MIRKGMTKGSGRKGYYNLIGNDPRVHSMSAKGMKQPQKTFNLGDKVISRFTQAKGTVISKQPFAVEYEYQNKKYAKLDNPKYWESFTKMEKQIIPKIAEIKSVKIRRAEGNMKEDPYLGKWQTFNNLKDANNRLMQISRTVPKTGGYDKTDVIVEFDNGFIYEGRWDVEHYSQPYPDTDIQKHIKDHFEYYAGKTERGKESIEKGYITKEGMKEAKKMLSKLNLGGKLFNVEVANNLKLESYIMRVKGKDKKSVIKKVKEKGFNAGTRFSSTYKGDFEPIILDEIEKFKYNQKSRNQKSGKCSASELKQGTKPDRLFNKSQLKAGIKIEKEHTNKRNLAKAIAKAHLIEDKDYYIKLKKAKL